MTTEQRKEELRKKFIDTMNLNAEVLIEGTDHVFDFFYSEIEARDKKHEEEWMLQLRAKEDAIKLYQKIHDKLQSLEEIIKAADEYIKYQIELDNISCQTGGNPITTGQRIIKANREMLEALSHYQHLKEKEK